MARKASQVTTASPAADEDMVSTSFKIPKTLHKQLGIASIQEERDMQDIVADALQGYFSKGGNRGPK